MTALDQFTFAALEATLPMVVVAWLAAVRMPFYGKRNSSEPLRHDLHSCIFLLLFAIAAARAYVGIAKYVFDKNLWYAGYLYPIRVGGINWGLPHGLPYLVVCLLVLWRLDLVLEWLGRKQYAGFYFFVFALLFGVSFGAIQGGLQSGLTEFFHSPDHVHDAQLFHGTLSDFILHNSRRYPGNEPHYLASHFMTHPPFLLAIWSVFLHSLSIEWFSFFCTLVFAGMIYCAYAGFKKELGTPQALTIGMMFLFTPALLIYGIGGDDVISYALWTASLCFAYLAVRREKFVLFGVGLIALTAAMAVQYASIVLLPAMFAIPSEAAMAELPAYVWKVKYWIVAGIAFVVFVGIAVYCAIGFNYVADMRDVFVWYREHNLPYELEHGQYAFALGSRLMDIFDFLLLGGPAIVFPIYKSLSELQWHPAKWAVRDVALAVLFVYVIFQTMGDGETARGWGGLYAVLLFGMLARFYSSYPAQAQRRLMRYQLGWALALQIPVNFGW